MGAATAPWPGVSGMTEVPGARWMSGNQGTARRVPTEVELFASSVIGLPETDQGLAIRKLREERPDLADAVLTQTNIIKMRRAVGYNPTTAQISPRNPS